MKSSLRITLIAQFFLAALVPTTIVTVLLISSFRDIQVDQQIEKQQIQANTVSMTINHQLDQAHASLMQMADDANVALSAESGIFGYSARSAMSALHANHPLIATTLMLDTQKFIVEATPQAGLVLDIDNVVDSLNDKLLDALGGQKTVVISEDPNLAALIRETGQLRVENQYQSNNTLVFMAPLFVSETDVIDSRSKLSGVLLSFILVEQIQAYADYLVPQLALTNTEQQDQLNTQQDVIITRAEVILPGGGQVIPLVFSVQADVVQAPVNKLVADYAIYALIATFVVLVIGWLFVRLELKPVAALNRIVKQYSSGDLSAHRTSFRFVEFNNVAELLAEMADNLKQHQEQLENKVAERTQELEKALANVQQINKELVHTQRQLIESEKSSQIGLLVAGVAHEINTPIGICVTASSVLEDKLTGLQDKFAENKLTKTAMNEFIRESSSCTEILAKNLERAAELIHSFKAVSVDQSSERDRVFNVNEYLKLVLRSLRNRLVKLDVTVSIRGDETLNINSYPGCLSQILTNLIINSMKHGFTDGLPHSITLEYHYQHSALHFSYQDDGIGVNETTLKKLFEPFYTTKRNQGGSGLGLSVVYNLVTQKLGGEIHCESQPGSGLTTLFSFPVEQVEVDKDRDRSNLHNV